MRKLTLLAAMLAALAADAVVVRKLPSLMVVESETMATDAMKATSVRSSNPAVFGAALRETGEAVLTGSRLGEAVLSYVDARGVFASRPVMVVPAYWDVLRGMFSEDPEVTISIVGDKVVVGGSTANVDTLRRVDAVKKLDAARIITQVTYSTAQIGELVKDFLLRSNITNIGVNVVGHEVCLSGRMYDAQSIEQLQKRVGGFVKDFPGITVNVDGLKIYKQKILINIEFVAYNDNLSRNLGFEGPDSITASADWNFGYSHQKSTGGGRSGSTSTTYTHERSGTRGYETTQNTETDSSGNTKSTGTTSQTPTDSENNTGSFKRDIANTLTSDNNWSHNWSGGANASVEGVQATINLLKRNGAAKSLYSTTLSTQSGIEAEFQSGGTFNRMTTPGAQSNGEMVSIEYGYIIKATPLIIDANTINLDFNLDNKEPLDNAGEHITRYQTKSKYLIRPGESIAISGYKHNSESEEKKGTPWLSKIPWIGEYLFGNTQNTMEMNDMLLVVTVNWSVEGDSDADVARLKELKERKVEVEMP